jgi:cytochrome b
MTVNVIRVWDLPTRLFHWSLAACFVGSILTGQLGGGAMDWHFRLGYAIASLLLFRIVWGLVGGHWSRFSTFIHGPKVVIAYLRGQAPSEYSVGHNPLGAFAIISMLMALAAQVATGLFSEDKGEAFGPLSGFISAATVRLVTSYHKNIGVVLLLGLALLHLVAIGYYFFHKRKNLVKAMLSGNTEVGVRVPSSKDDAWSRCMAVVVFALCTTLVIWAVRLGGY